MIIIGVRCALCAEYVLNARFAQRCGVRRDEMPGVVAIYTVCCGGRGRTLSARYAWKCGARRVV